MLCDFRGLFKNIIITFTYFKCARVCVCVYLYVVCVLINVSVHVWRPGDNLWKSLLSAIWVPGIGPRPDSLATSSVTTEPSLPTP